MELLMMHYLLLPMGSRTVTVDPSPSRSTFTPPPRKIDALPVSPADQRTSAVDPLPDAPAVVDDDQLQSSSVPSRPSTCFARVPGTLVRVWNPERDRRDLVGIVLRLHINKRTDACAFDLGTAIPWQQPTPGESNMRNEVHVDLCTSCHRHIDQFLHGLAYR